MSILRAVPLPLLLLTTPLAADTPADPRAVVAEYYRHIDRREYAAAFALWEVGDDGRNAMGQTLAEFREGFARTRRVNAVVGPAEDPEGAAGSVYITIPVRVTARTSAGRVQRFAGSYVLRHSNVEGGRRDWRLTSGRLRPGR